MEKKLKYIQVIEPANYPGGRRIEYFVYITKDEAENLVGTKMRSDPDWRIIEMLPVGE